MIKPKSASISFMSQWVFALTIDGNHGAALGFSVVIQGFASVLAAVLGEDFCNLQLVDVATAHVAELLAVNDVLSIAEPADVHWTRACLKEKKEIMRLIW